MGLEEQAVYKADWSELTPVDFSVIESCWLTAPHPLFLLFLFLFGLSFKVKSWIYIPKGVILLPLLSAKITSGHHLTWLAGLMSDSGSAAWNQNLRHSFGESHRTVTCPGNLCVLMCSQMKLFNLESKAAEFMSLSVWKGSGLYLTVSRRFYVSRIGIPDSSCWVV